ncbi:MAG TPA: hypothetical protein VJL61_11660 [Rhodanobacteraceae bacterium]|nr:hypothetical protein [Rhodanobacteraceae bacterium]
MPKMIGIRIVVNFRPEKIGWAQRGHKMGICAQSRAGAQICIWVMNNGSATIDVRPHRDARIGRLKLSL